MQQEPSPPLIKSIWENELEYVGTENGEPAPRWELSEEEVRILNDVVAQQNSVIRSLGDQMLPPPCPTVGFSKPRDIPLLELLYQLQGLEAAARL